MCDENDALRYALAKERAEIEALRLALATAKERVDKEEKEVEALIATENSTTDENASEVGNIVDSSLKNEKDNVIAIPAPVLSPGDGDSTKESG